MRHPYLAKLLFLLLFASFGFPSGAFAQTGSVSGRITDTKNEGIPGATVLIEGTSLGGSSNADGTYSITNVPAGPHTVVISFVGFNSTRLPVTVVAGQNAEVSSSLSENTTQLAEAVVVGYGTQRRQDVTGAIATVSSKDFVQSGNQPRAAYSRQDCRGEHYYRRRRSRYQVYHPHPGQLFAQCQQ